MTFQNKPPVYYALLSLQTALGGSVTPQLRAVTVDVDKSMETVILFFFYDGEISEELHEISSLVGTETEYPCYLNEEHVLRLDFPEKIPLRGKFAYLRKEPIPQRFEKEDRRFLMPEYIPLAVLRLDAQEALLGRVTPEMRHVSISIDEKKKELGIYFIFDGEISEENKRLAHAVIHETPKSFPDYEVSSRLVRIDYPKDYSSIGEQSVFRKREEGLIE